MWIRIWRPDYFYVKRQRLVDASDLSPFNRGWAQGFGFFVLGVYWNEGRPASYNEIHYPTRETHRVTINGREWPISRETASYETILTFADQKNGATVTWYSREGGASGTLRPGQRVLLADGLVFNAVVTGSA